MFSAVRIATVVAIVALGGSLALIAGPLGPSAGPALVPGAEAPSPEPPVRVTGSSRTVAIPEMGVETVEDGVAGFRGRIGRGEPVMDDPRVSGTMEYVHNSDDHGGMGPTWGTLRLENDNGAWEGVVSGYWYAPETRTAGWLVGEGAYEGLSYYHESVLEHGYLTIGMSGIIYSGDPPEDPPTFE